MATLGCAKKTSGSLVLFCNPDSDSQGNGMEFQLTYEGLLWACNRDTHVNHKHEIRKHFHPQLKRLWMDEPRLRVKKYPWPSPKEAAEREGGPVGPPWPEEVSKLFPCGAYNFVPLVMNGIDLLCGLNILWLRPEEPGALIQSGDIDNRLKTLFDALRMPTSDQFGKYKEPDADEVPFHCLLEDDKLISRLEVETGLLLQPTVEPPNPNDTRLIIKVKLQPRHLNWVNKDFA
jgi:hypothetical protein